ncbi:type II secretion system protein GspH [Pseudomonas putida]|nr:type II secretion system minor pseudopilin GspH [Pseudomonas monteilii]MBF8744194.1 type II secretion system minor pseudopilin GspH [Pseudomonas monteilii]TDJ78796.1 type II secretion system protein GspH [Pseudomonas putida]
MMRRQARGFTLLEMMLVLVLVGIVMGLAGFQAGRDPQRLAREEASLFLQLVQHARHQAVLEGQALGVHIDPHGYQLLKAAGRIWQVEGPRHDTGLDLLLEIDSLPVVLASDSNIAQLVFASNDEYTPFSLSFQQAGVELARVTSDGLNDPWLEL